ncbi:MAG: FliI/YscN family ATPase, partial [Bdellovibrionales bacterium]|nr:FliI/YscN family ATPase [Bdellovibrionales bacterium]
MDNFQLNFARYSRALDFAKLNRDIGKVTQVTGFLIKGYLPGASVGSLVDIYPNTSPDPFLAEVVGFQDRSVLMMPLGTMVGVGLGSRIVMKKNQATIPLGDALLGRVINPLCEPMDKLGRIDLPEEQPLYSDAFNPLDRPPITEALSLGVRSIDGLLTVGKGQRVGIMAGSGVGKSVLLGMLAKNTDADVNVIALVGERGREVREFIEHTLGEEGIKKSVIICATSDQSALLRMRAAFVASCVAEYFSRSGKDVLLLMDSVTRFAMAQREIGLNVGEPPSSKGYTPSVFSLLPKILERAGRFEGQGSITGLYTVLVEGDDIHDPIGDAVRSIVDGHIVLDRNLAHRGHFPAINILQSTSRVMTSIVPKEQILRARQIRELIANYKDAEDLINIGAYKQGSNPKIDAAIKWNDQITQFLRQDVSETS